MTAAEIFQAVKDVPREAWPDGMVQSALDNWFLDGNGHTVPSYVTPADAELLFIGSMVVWLSSELRSDGISIASDDETEDGWIVEIRGHNGHMRSASGRGRLGALAAACKAIGGA